MSLFSRLKGYLRDDIDPRDPGLFLIVGDSVPPASASLRQHVGEVLTQRGEDCVANALAKATQVRLAVQGVVNPPLLSRRLLYWEARSDLGGNARDAGIQPRQAMRAIQNYGYCLETACPYTPYTPFAAPPPSAYQASYDQAGALQYYRTEDGWGRVDGIKRAIDAGHPPIVALQIDAAFEAYSSGVWTKSGDTLGGHMLCALEYDERGAWLLSSWGEAFGDGGGVWCSWETLADNNVTSDCYAITFAQPETTAP